MSIDKDRYNYYNFNTLLQDSWTKFQDSQYAFVKEIELSFNWGQKEQK